MSYDFKLRKGDLVLAKSGDLDIVTGTDKLQQDVLKIAVTPVNGNKSFPWYGSSASSALVGNTYDVNFSVDSATDQLRSAIENLQKLQLNQSQYQFVSTSEMIAVVKDIRINVNPTDIRVINVTISVLTKALNTVNTTYVIKI